MRIKDSSKAEATPEEKNRVSDDQFHMIRCLIAMAHADGVVSKEERIYVEALMQRVSLTPDQKDIIFLDLSTPQNVGDILGNIHDLKFRAQIMYFARIMAYKDGVFHPREEDLLDKLRYYSLQGIDVEKVREDVTRVTQMEIASLNVKLVDHRPKKGDHFVSWFQWFDEVMITVGIDVLGE